MVVLSWVSLCQDAAAEMLYPILPLFLTSALGAPPAVVGLVEGVAEATAAAGKAISGRLADVRRRVPLVAWGYGISAVAKPLIGMATGWPLVLVARFLDRAGKGLRTSPRDALISAATGPASRGRAFGFHRAMDTAGAVIGPLLGLALYAALGHRLRPLFFIAFLPAVLSVALIKLVDEPPRAPDNRPPATKDPLPAGYWRVVGFLTLFGLANFSDALVILRVHALGLGVSGVLLGYVLYNVSYAGLSFPAGAVSDRVPRHLVFAGGMGVFAAAYTGLGVVTTHSWVWLLLPLYGGFAALTDGVGKAWVADLLPERAVGRGLGYYQAITGGAALLAGGWAGLAWGGSGRVPMVLSGAVAAVLATALVLGGRMLVPLGPSEPSEPSGPSEPLAPSEPSEPSEPNPA